MSGPVRDRSASRRGNGAGGPLTATEIRELARDRLIESRLTPNAISITGLIGNIVVGIVGAFIAGWLLPRIGIVIGGGMIASIINATIGAVVLLVIVGLIRRA